MSGVHALTLSPTMEAIFAPYAVIAATPCAAALETNYSSVLYKIVTPYDVKAWHLALQHTDLLHLFLNLVHDLVHSTPISDLPSLSHMFIPNNLGSADIDPAYMDSFLVEEIASSRMDSPYSIEQAQSIFNGHFRTAPLGFVQNPGLSALRLICHHSKKDHLGMSTNGCIYMSAGVTKFYLAAHAVDFVSVYILSLTFSPPSHVQMPFVIHMSVFHIAPL